MTVFKQLGFQHLHCFLVLMALINCFLKKKKLKKQKSILSVALSLVTLGHLLTKCPRVTAKCRGQTENRSGRFTPPIPHLLISPFSVSEKTKETHTKSVKTDRLCFSKMWLELKWSVLTWYHLVILHEVKFSYLQQIGSYELDKDFTFDLCVTNLDVT